ncbi:hypothetical protein GGH12_004658 [Coemansia sp. RSA 1822]|nr:hypothetical protein LPJ76_004474 [Coemansia sp. RSA 638]KAJ2560640.1 hypothetical protein GGH12_004658 [Coemansia sp. RSA 1822]
MRVWVAVLAATAKCHSLGIVESDHGLRTLDTPLLDALELWGMYAASAYQRFEDWSQCEACQKPSICNTDVNATWSTLVPAFSRGYVGIHHTTRQIVVVFRGSTHIMDALTNSQIMQVAWPSNNTNQTRVHAGFVAAYMAAQPHVLEALHRIDTDKRLAAYSLHFIGHSLGAAQATLAYIDWRLSQPHTRRNSRLVTFGAPRIGNPQFARMLDSLSNHTPTIEQENVLRVVHECDIVTHLPRSMLLLGEYVHGGHEIWARDIDADRKAQDLIVCQHTQEDPDCSASINMLRWTIADHFVYPGMQLGIPRY